MVNGNVGLTVGAWGEELRLAVPEKLYRMGMLSKYEVVSGQVLQVPHCSFGQLRIEDRPRLISVRLYTAAAGQVLHGIDEKGPDRMAWSGTRSTSPKRQPQEPRRAN